MVFFINTNADAIHKCKCREEWEGGGYGPRGDMSHSKPSEYNIFILLKLQELWKCLVVTPFSYF